MPAWGELMSSLARERGMADSLDEELGGGELGVLWLLMAKRCWQSTTHTSGYLLCRLGGGNSSLLEP